MLELTCLIPKLLSAYKSPGSLSFWFHGQCLCVKTEVNSVCWMRECLGEGSNSQTLKAHWGGRKLLLEQRWTPNLASPEKGVLTSKRSLFHPGNNWNLEIFHFPGERDKPHFTKENEKKICLNHIWQNIQWGWSTGQLIEAGLWQLSLTDPPLQTGPDSISQQLGRLPGGSHPSPWSSKNIQVD